jgi:hypothetical protein
VLKVGTTGLKTAVYSAASKVAERVSLKAALLESYRAVFRRDKGRNKSDK